MCIVGVAVAWPVFLGGIHWLTHAEIEAPGLSLLGGRTLAAALLHSSARFVGMGPVVKYLRAPA
jgi:hypothetical protein